ncbi:conserved hypothetical protein [Coccidioides posadasii str. Silveira]|uniref:Uncharacterized protein n=2 Tax=Coccidioides posadasii TaxID=199306 RepID=E9D6M5_COCPS|nr:conserved hypothetical protein [Coccidioides posadasii str. Silveira]KMM68584.1 hypothetical protein CPAG_04910 [Coccidioides posadasii RMSCC 3488]
MVWMHHCCHVWIQKNLLKLFQDPVAWDKQWLLKQEKVYRVLRNGLGEFKSGDTSSLCLFLLRGGHFPATRAWRSCPANFKEVQDGPNCRVWSHRLITSSQKSQAPDWTVAAMWGRLSGVTLGAKRRLKDWAVLGWMRKSSAGRKD